MIESGNRGELGQTEQRTRQRRHCNERADERLPFLQPEPKAAAVMVAESSLYADHLTLEGKRSELTQELLRHTEVDRIPNVGHAELGKERRV
jgi:hypothetical protein